MSKPYKLLLALGIAVASLSSCSRANYAVNTTAPTSEPMQVVAPASDAAASGTATVTATAPKGVLAEAAPTHELATVVAAQPTGKIVKKAVQPVAGVTPELVAADEATRPAVKPSLVQRLALKGVAKKLNKIQQKQATAGTAEAQSLKRTSIYLAIAGLLAILVGILIAGGSVAGGSGAGFVIGAILAYLGYIALVVGIILLIVALIRGH